MRCGDFSAAWEISDRMLSARRGVPCWDQPRHLQYIWNGQPLAGQRVLIRCYHGLGDTVQFIRYVPLVKHLAAHTSVWVQPELLPLLRSMLIVDELIPLHDGTPEVEYDVDMELMELPHVFRTTLDTIPTAVPYLRVPEVRRFADDELHVGVVWRSGGWDDRRSIATALLAPLAEIEGVRLHPLQLGSAAAEWPSQWGENLATGDAVELARTMRSLDRVISVDSFPLHLAGALGVRTWALLHSDPDWRWMLNRTDTPWYPTMRLWRQPRAGDWESVIEAVAASLRACRATSR
jgi:ADP-heptose:LPS heptosyltransferase